VTEIKKVRKRDGRKVGFNPSKITEAVQKALKASDQDEKAASSLSDQVVEILKKESSSEVVNIEDIQDVVEKVLIENNFSDAAKAYILYRQKHSEIRNAKNLIGVKDDLKLGINALRVLKKRYLARNQKGEVKETPVQMFKRVAQAVARVDKEYGETEIHKTEESFYKAMMDLEFIPNSPTLMNAGLSLGQLSACFVLPVEDSIEGIFDSVKHMALIHQSGGGTGFSFSNLRPAGDIVKSTKGVASGPVSFMKVFNVATDVIKQGGRRRGANMGILNVDHPDILKFIDAKSREDEFSNFNLSVAVTDDFIEKVKSNKKYSLVNPRTGKKQGELSANHVFDLIATMAWKTGDPGLSFLDEINRKNATPQIGNIESTNPCGEVPLFPYESCNLGSINLSKMVNENKKEIRWEKLKETTQLGVHFLDNIIEANKYPFYEIKKTTGSNRKIGLGVMGFAEMLIKLDIPYNSQKAVDTADKVMEFLAEQARQKSSELGKERGSFSHFKGSLWDKKGYKQMRNATVTTIAPTGTISVIAGCSSGIEPLFAVVFIRNVMEGTKLLETNDLFEKMAKQKGFYSKELMNRIAKRGSVQDVEGIPDDVKRLFVTALEMRPDWHVKIQAAFQKHTDNAVSKTVNLPVDASSEDVKNVFMLAHQLKCKGITVYRYGSKDKQVLNIGHILQKKTGKTEHEYVNADSEYSGGCPDPSACTL